jgi:hypothetical protein
MYDDIYTDKVKNMNLRFRYLKFPHYYFETPVIQENLH